MCDGIHEHYVSAQMSKLAKAIEAVKNDAESIRGRLKDVLGSPIKEGVSGGEEKEVQLCPLASNLMSLNGRIAKISDVLREILIRLEL